MKTSKKVLFTLGVSNIVDIITNSSSELFVLGGNEREVVEEMLDNIYDDWRNEYVLEDIREAGQSLLETMVYFMYHSYQTCIYGFTKEEMYENPEEMDGTSYINFDLKVKNNGENNWTTFVVDSNIDKVRKGIEKDYGRFYLMSIEDNPNWDGVESLETHFSRRHIG